MTTILPRDLPGIDVDIAVKRAGGDEDIIKEFFLDFHEDYHDVTSKINQAVGDENIDLVHRIAHSIKGLAGNVGATGLMEAARELETAAASGSMEEIVATFNAFKPVMAQVVETLARFASDNKSNAPDPVPEDDTIPDRETLAPLLLELDDMLEKGRFEALGSVSAVKSLLRSGEYAESVRELETLTSRYEFEEARIKLRQISRRLEIPI